MKFATIALFLGTISAADFQEELINELKIQISKAGQQEIAKEAKDVKHTLKKIEHSRPVRNLEASLKRWAHTKEVHQIEVVDKAFWHSKEGQRLIKEWKDVGHVLKQHLKHDKKTGTLSLDNKYMDDLEDELEDVQDQYKALDNGKWDKAYQAAWKAALHTKEFQSVARRAKAFKGSNEGKMLHKEIVDLKKSIKKNLKISDVEESSDDEEDLEEVANLLTIRVSPKGEKEVEKEVKDVKISMRQLKRTKLFQKLRADYIAWLKTKEVKAIAKIEREFYASKEGQRLIRDWHDFGVALKKGIYHNKSGIHINNKALNGEIQDELDDVVDHYDTLKGGKWDVAYKKAWMAALKTQEAKQFAKDDAALKKTVESANVKKQVEDLIKSVKKNVKVTDLPKKWVKKVQAKKEVEEEDEFDFVAKKAAKQAKKDDTSDSDEEDFVAKKAAKKADTSDSSADEEDFVAKKAAKKVAKKAADSSDSSDEELNTEELEELLKITISKAGQKEISKEWTDVENVWKKIDESRPVRNVEASLKRWVESKEMKDLETLDKKFQSTARGKKMKAEIEDVFRQLDRSVFHNKSGLSIDNGELKKVDDEVDDVVAELKSFKKSKWDKLYENQMKKTFSNRQAESVHRRMVTFKKSAEGKALKKEMHEFKDSLKKNVKVSDLPKNFGEEDNLFLF